MEVSIKGNFKKEQLQAATTVTAAETLIGTVVPSATYTTLGIWIDYTKGDETSFDIIPKFMLPQDADEYPYGSWSIGAVATFTNTVFRMTATGKYYILLDIKGISKVKIYGDATGGTPTGTAQVTFTLCSP